MNAGAPRFRRRLIERLPAVRGRYSENAPLASITWFRVGGPAEVMYKPADRDDLAAFLRDKPADVDVTVIGVGSNLLVRDHGVAGVVIRLGRGFAGIEFDETRVTAGAMALDYNVALTCCDAAVSGLEFLAGVPGTVGGGLRMNAGAYGREFKDVTTTAVAMDPQGAEHRLGPEEWAPRYRGCGVADDWIFVEAVMQGAAGDKETIARAIADIQSARADTQPVRERTGGSTFANPDGHEAWSLIEAAGCRGLRVGGAMVSEKHCNFLISTGDASAADLEALGEEVRRRVRDHAGIDLRWEIRRIGMSAEPGRG